jgi:hypothetical protein
MIEVVKQRNVTECSGRKKYGPRILYLSKIDFNNREVIFKDN